MRIADCPGVRLLAGLVILVSLATPGKTFQNTYGLVVEAVAADSIAAKAGLKVGDRIMSYDDKPVLSPAALQALEDNTFGKKEVALKVRRGDETLTLFMPPGKLGIMVRPELPITVLNLYQQGKAAMSLYLLSKATRFGPFGGSPPVVQEKKASEAIAKWLEAAKSAEEMGDLTAAAWVYERLAWIYENQSKWKEAITTHQVAWALVRRTTDLAEQSRTLFALGRCNSNVSDLAEAANWYEAARRVDETAGNEIWLAIDLIYLGNVACGQSDLKTAEDYYRRAFAIRQRLAPDSLEIAAIFHNLGFVARNSGDLNTAEDYHCRALEICERLAPNTMAVRISLSNLGHVAIYRDDLQMAQYYLSRALAIRHELLPDTRHRVVFPIANASNLDNLGNVSSSPRDLDAVHDYLSRALMIKQRLGPDSLGVALSLNNLGYIADLRRDHQAASEYHDRAFAIHKRLIPEKLVLELVVGADGSEKFAINERLATDSLDVADCLERLGSIASWRHIQAAEDYYRRAFGIRERLAPDSLEVAETLVRLSSIAYLKGNSESALYYQNQALAIRERLAPGSLMVAEILLNLGSGSLKRRDFGAAQKYFRRALVIQEQLAPDSFDLTITLDFLGRLAQSRGDPSAAQEYFSRELAVLERLEPNSMAVAGTLSDLGDLAFSRGDLQVAQEYHRRALAIRERLEPAATISVTRLGDMAFSRGDLRVAQDYYMRALGIAEQIEFGSEAVPPVLADLGYLALKERRFRDALTYFARAISIIEPARRKILSHDRAYDLSFRTRLYIGLLRSYIGLNDLPTAFATGERFRARGLIELLAERQLDLLGDAAIDLLRKHDELDQNRSIDFAKLIEANTVLSSTREELGRLEFHQQTEAIAQIKEKMKHLNEQIGRLSVKLYEYGNETKKLEVQIRRNSPKLAALQYPQPLNLKGAQAALDRGTLLLSYYVDENETYLFAVIGTTLKVLSLPVGKKILNEEVNLLRDEVSRKKLGNPAQRGKKLYDILIRPTQTLINQAKRILICPDGPLHTLPFAALVSQTKPRLRHLIEEKPLHTIVSMTVYAETRRHGNTGNQADSARRLRRYTGTQRRIEKVLAVGDALFTEDNGQTSLRNQAQPASASEEERAIEDPEVERLRKRGANFGRLKYARTEIEEIGRLFGSSAAIRLGEKATETTVRQQSKDAEIVHFAVHGWLDDQIGLNSALVLTNPELFGKNITKNDNGLLQAWEIFEQLKLNADLVVLSACDTGLGTELEGEGLIGMTRAFQYAGAKSIIVSLWEVNDESTAVLMSAFYRELRRGTTKDVALQRATAAVRRNPKWRHPYYWSPFVLVGGWN